MLLNMLWDEFKVSWSSFRKASSMKYDLPPVWIEAYYKKQEFAPWGQIRSFYSRPLFRSKSMYSEA